MKNIFITMLLMILTSLAFSQSAVQMPLKAGDTLSAVSAVDTVTRYISATAGYSAMAIQVIATKQSGTVSAKAYLYGSLDGTNYTLTDSSAAFTDITTNVAYFTKVTTPYTKYKVQVRPATTVATTQGVLVTIWYVLKKHF